MTLTYDLLADVLIYSFAAWFSYILFSLSQLFRIRYIERMAHPAPRLITKFLEYLAFSISCILLVFISDYHAIIYYVGDLILLGLFVRRFIKSDRLQRSEYLRHYTHSKHKLTNRMILNLYHYPTHHDN